MSAVVNRHSTLISGYTVEVSLEISRAARARSDAVKCMIGHRTDLAQMKRSATHSRDSMNASAPGRHCFDGLACRPPDRLAWSHGGCIPCGAISANHNSDLLLADDRDDYSNDTNPCF